MVEFRPATRADFEAFYGRKPPFSLRAICAHSTTGVVGVGGYFVSGAGPVVFADQRGMGRKDIVRGARRLLEMINGMPVVAMAGPEGETALRHYGFRRNGEVWER